MQEKMMIPGIEWFQRSRFMTVAGFATLGLVLVLCSAPAHAAQLTATWSDATPDDHTGFKVERKTGTTGAFAQIATTGATVMTYIDTTVTAGTTYCYRVRAYNTAGDSAYTPEGCAAAATTPVTFTLSLAKAGTGTGTVTSSPSGINCGSTCSTTVVSGTSVTLTAAAATGSTFTGWGGACAGTGPCTLTVSQARDVTATFTPQTYTLSVAKSGTGTGTVTANTGGINCGSTCSASYTSGASVTLTATAASGSTFTGWSGACTGTGSCVVTVSAVTSVSAAFALPSYGLTVTKGGTGSGTVTSNTGGINCGSTCSASYTSGTSVTLTAAAASGSTFTGWSGACTGTGSCVVSMTAAQSVTATFALPTYAFTVTKAGTGSGTVTSAPAGVNCGATCSASFNSGTSVTLTAVAATGSVFAGWSGACTGTSTTCTSTMSQARNVTATFTAQNYTLSVTTNGMGAGTVTANTGGINCGSTCSASYSSGTSVTLTAAPATGSTFTGWSGACTGTGSCVVSMTAAKSVTATFASASTSAQTVGIYRAGWWYFDKNDDSNWEGCATDKCVGFGGDSTDVLVVGDWNGDGKTKIGVYRGSTGMWYLDYNGNGTWDGCTTDRCFGFGIPTDTPIVGDWTGDGKTKIGVYRASTGVWYLDYNGNGTWDSTADRSGGFGGDATDTPVVGDWTGDGKTKIGVYRKSTGTWYLDTNGAGTWDATCSTILCLAWGSNPSDLPVVGDWTGDGKTKIGVYRAGSWYLDTSGNGAWNGCTTDKCMSFGGDPTDQPVVGDWTGDLKAKIGVYRASNGYWYLDKNGNGAWDGCTTDKCIQLGGYSADKPVVGRW